MSIFRGSVPQTINFGSTGKERLPMRGWQFAYFFIQLPTMVPQAGYHLLRLTTKQTKLTYWVLPLIWTFLLASKIIFTLAFRITVELAFKKYSLRPVMRLPKNDLSCSIWTRFPSTQWKTTSNREIHLKHIGEYTAISSAPAIKYSTSSMAASSAPLDYSPLLVMSSPASPAPCPFRTALTAPLQAARWCVSNANLNFSQSEESAFCVQILPVAHVSTFLNASHARMLNTAFIAQI